MPQTPQNPLTIGILGGGQLARMSAYVAYRMGMHIAILERQPNSPAALLTDLDFVGDWLDPVLLKNFAEKCDVITLENEFIDAGALEVLEGLGKTVFPTGRTLAKIQDKFIQKETLLDAGLPVAEFMGVDSTNSLKEAAESFGFPFLLKARRESYDGYGNRDVQNTADFDPLLQQLGFPERKVLAEKRVDFNKELAIMIARNGRGHHVAYPVVETIQQGHICKKVLAPADIPGAVRNRARELALQAVEAVDGVGIFGVEMFWEQSDGLLINEIAPRPHNSGHFTIESCVTSQFENHLRAILDWPLGSTDMVTPAAVMVNLLGKREGAVTLQGLSSIMADAGLKVHIYGKKDSRQGRKLGHLTVLGHTLSDCLTRAEAADNLLVL